jgi:hypothetical protein
MAHYAFLDKNNIVVDVIVGKDEYEGIYNWELYYTQERRLICKRTSYNTKGGIYYNPITNLPDIDQSKSFRKNYAGIGFIYDVQLDAFIAPKPYPSWILNEETCIWEAPVLYPNDNQLYSWDESTKSWVLSVNK